jgi:hypothetical protein
MEKPTTSPVYLATVGAAILGAAAGGVLIPWLWADGQTLGLGDIFAGSVLGVMVGTFPGWIAGLICRLVVEKSFSTGDRWRSPAAVSFAVGFLVGGVVSPWLLSLYAHALDSIGRS